MTLYHCSDRPHERLTPQISSRRHSGEGAPQDTPVVWLSNAPESIFTQPDDSILRYRHEVEVPADDPHLHEDTGLSDLVDSYSKLTGTNHTLRWFYYTQEIPVRKVAEYDKTIKQWT